jgi:hypothetical protein
MELLIIGAAVVALVVWLLCLVTHKPVNEHKLDDAVYEHWREVGPYSGKSLGQFREEYVTCSGCGSPYAVGKAGRTCGMCGTPR